MSPIFNNSSNRQDLLGHRSGRITTHYSSAELQNLYEAANKVCSKTKGGVVIALIQRKLVRPVIKIKEVSL